MVFISYVYLYNMPQFVENAWDTRTTDAFNTILLVQRLLRICSSGTLRRENNNATVIFVCGQVTRIRTASDSGKRTSSIITTRRITLGGELNYWNGLAGFRGLGMAHALAFQPRSTPSGAVGLASPPMPWPARGVAALRARA